MHRAQIPVPADDDHEDVVLALHTAGALWSRGEPQEAVRWVRRAAASAGENNHDARAFALARAAADLSAELETAQAVPPEPAAPNQAAPSAAPFSKSASTTLLGIAPEMVAPPAPRAFDASGLLHDADDTDKTAVDQPSLGALELRPNPNAVCRAYRVAVRQGAAPGAFSVRILDPGEACVDGAIEALLVNLDGRTVLPVPTTTG